MSLRNNYPLLKWLSLGMGIVSSPVSIYLGYSLGIESYFKAAVAFGLTVLLFVADFFIAWRMLELLTGGRHGKENDGQAET